MTRGPRTLAAAGLAALVFLLFLGQRDIATSHEARVAETAREMAVTGWPWSCRATLTPPVVLVHALGMDRLKPDLSAPPIAVNAWAIPLLNGEIRLQKPPLPYWCAAVLYRLFGFSEFATRVTPALLGALGTLLMYDLARLLIGRTKAYLAVLVWISTYFIPDEYRKSMADPYLAFFTLACIWAWVRESQNTVTCPRPSSPPCLRAFVPSCLILFYLSLALGLLAKGPPLFLHLAIALIAFHFCFRRKIPGSVKSHLLGLALLLVIALPWPLYVRHHIKNAVELWRYESVGELADNVENARPWWFYLPNIFFIALPWAAAEITGVFVVLARPTIRRRRLFPLIWLGTTVLFFSFVNLKKNPYLLPATPAQTLLIAEGLAAALAVAIRSRRVTWGGIVLAIQTTIGVVCAVALMVVVRTHTAHPPWATAFSVVVLLASCWPIVLLQLPNPRRWLRGQVAAYVLLTLGIMFCVETEMDNARSAKALCAELALKADAPNTAILRSRLPEEVAVYLPIDSDDRAAMATHLLVVVEDDSSANDRLKQGGDPPIPDPETFAASVPDGRVIFVDRVPMNSAPGDSRWKVYELTVERMRYARRTADFVSSR